MSNLSIFPVESHRVYLANTAGNSERVEDATERAVGIKNERRLTKRKFLREMVSGFDRVKV